jgi:hypothetical protein
VKFVGEVDERDEHDEHGGESWNTTHTHTKICFPSLAQTTISIEVAGKDLLVEVPQIDRRIESREI